MMKSRIQLARNAVSLCITATVLWSCCGFVPPSMESPEPDLKTVAVHITIDDEVIDSGDAHDVIDPVWWTATIYDGEAEYNRSLAGFSQEQRVLFAVLWHTAEVNNGGHDQFFFNSTGVVWQDALAGYKAIGLEEAAAILAESADRLGGNPSLDRRTRQKQLATHQPDFDDLDSRFYKLQATVDFDEAMMAYIRSHREAFYFDGDVEKPEPLRK